MPHPRVRGPYKPTICKHRSLLTLTLDTYYTIELCLSWKVRDTEMHSSDEWKTLRHLPSIGNGFAVQDIPGKGKGIIAQRSFAQGEVILAETPIFTLRAEDLTRRNAESVIFAISKCTPVQREGFYGLYSCHSDFPRELGIFETNVLPCGTNDAKTSRAAVKGGIFLLGSRFNSSCMPNTNNNWDAESEELVFRAIKDVRAGDELCIAYGNVLAAREKRQAEMKRKFGFVCKCEACMLSGIELEESDYRRECLGGMYRDHVQGTVEDPMESLGEVCLRHLSHM